MHDHLNLLPVRIIKQKMCRTQRSVLKNKEAIGLLGKMFANGAI